MNSSLNLKNETITSEGRVWRGQYDNLALYILEVHACTASEESYRILDQ